MSGRVMFVLVLAALAALVTWPKHREVAARVAVSARVERPDAGASSGSARDAGVEAEVAAGPPAFGSPLAPTIRVKLYVLFAPGPAVDPEAALSGACHGEAAFFARVEEAGRPFLRTARSRHIDRDALRAETRVGLTDAAVAKLAGSAAAFVLDVAAPVAVASATVEHTSRLGACIADATHGAIWDDATRQLFSAREFSTRRVESWKAGQADLVQFFMVNYSKDGDYERCQTAGLARFGLPELVVEGYPRGLSERMSDLVNHVAIALARRGALPLAGFVDVDLDAPGAQEATRAADALPGARRKGRFVLREVAPVDRETARQLQIGFDGWPGPDVHARQHGALNALFGGVDALEMTDFGTPEMIAAIARAKAGLPAVRERFARGLRDGEHLVLKVPFETTTPGRPELLWIEVVRWQGERIDGVLVNRPDDVPGMALGADVTTRESEVRDWSVTHADGSHEGNETAKVP